MPSGVEHISDSDEHSDGDDDADPSYTSKTKEHSSLAEHKNCLRTERALRFVLGAIGPLIISFGYKLPTDTHYSLLNLQLSYLCGVFYCIFAALAPPQMSSISIIGSGAFVGIVLGIGLATGAFAVTLIGGKGWGLFAFAVGMWLTAPLKTGPVSALTNLTSLCTVYGGAIGFIMLVPFADPGLHAHLPTKDLIGLFGLANANEKFKGIVPKWVMDDAVSLFLQLQSMCTPATNKPPVPADCHVQNSSLIINEGELHGMTLGIFMSPETVAIDLKPGPTILRLAWTSWGTTGLILPLLTLFFITVAFFAMSMLLPLPRVRTAFNVTRAEMIRIMAGPLRDILLAAESVASSHTAESSRQVARNKALNAAFEVTDRCAPLISAAKISSFEPSWPPMGFQLLHLMPDTVMAIRHCARVTARQAAEPVVAGSSELTKRAIHSARYVIQASVGLLSAMPHSGDDLTGVPAGSRDVLNAAVEDLKQVSHQLPESEHGWSIRYGVVGAALTVAGKVEELAERRSRANRTCFGAMMGTIWLIIGFFIPLGAPFYRLGLYVIQSFRPRNRGGGMDWNDVRVEIGLVLGVTALVAPSLFVPGWTAYGVNDEFKKMLGLAGRFSIWCCLGFIVSFQLTLEGAVIKSLLRAAGTILGAFAAWLAVTICGKRHDLLIVWLLVSYGIAVGYGSNPINRLLGFNLAWGYAAQLFTYTETIIVVETAIGVGNLNDLTVSRLLGQLLGISVALVCSLLIWVRAKNAAKARVAFAFDLCSAVLEDWQEQNLDHTWFRLVQAIDKVDAAQVALDDAKVDQMRRGGKRRKIILGEGGVGIEEARDVIDDLWRIYDLLKETDDFPDSNDLSATQAAFEAASARLQSEDTEENDEESQLVGSHVPRNEISWLLRRAAQRAGEAGFTVESEETGDLL